MRGAVVWMSGARPYAMTALLLAVSCLDAASYPGAASWFNKGLPVPDWGLQAAKTKTPDDVKDVSSVVLLDDYLEMVDAQGRATERRRKAIRILKPQGRDNFCGVAYDVDEKINYFRAWTIAADEKTYQAQDTDFVDVGLSENSNMLVTAKVRVARPPAIDVGAVVVCESEELTPPYSREKIWDFQGDVPIVSEVLEVDLPAGMTYAVSWHRHDAVAPTEIPPDIFAGS